MMSIMHSQISRAINNAMTERVTPEIQNIVSSMSSSGNRDTEASVSPNSQENRECSSGFKSKFAKKNSQSACDLRDIAGHSPYNVISQRNTVILDDDQRNFTGKHSRMHNLNIQIPF